MTSEVPAKFKIILFLFMDPKYQIEKMCFRTLMVRSRIHLLNTTVGTGDTVVHLSKEIGNFLTWSLHPNGVWAGQKKRNKYFRLCPKKVTRGQKVAKIGQYYSGYILKC